MKLPIFVLSALFSLNVLAGLRPDKTEYDFGQLSNIDSASVDVTLQNTGSKAVKLEAVRLSCGCATANYKKDSTVKPQEKSVITIQFSPKEFSGRVRKPFYIKYKELGEGGKSETLRLFIRAKVKKEVYASPETLLIKSQKDSHSEIVSFENRTKETIKDLKIKVNNEFCTVSFEKESSEVNPGESREIKVTVKDSLVQEHPVYSKIEYTGKVGSREFSLESVVKILPSTKK